MKYRMSRLAPALVIALVSSGFVFAQGQRGAQPATVAATAKSSAPVDLTGYWVSIVSEDWRIRMITPQKGDYPGIPINAAASFRQTSAARRAYMARLFRRRVGTSVDGAPWPKTRSRKLESSNDQSACRLRAEEWRSLQRGCRPRRILRRHQGFRWHVLVDPHNEVHGSHVSDPALYSQYSFKERS